MIADMVADPTTTYREQIHEEVDALPDEQVLMVLKIVQAVRENMALKSAEESFKQGWREAQAGQVLPIETLWDNIHAE